MKAHNVAHKEGNFFLIKFDAPANSIATLYDSFKRDIDIIKPNITKQEKMQKIECTLEEEMQPVAYRKDVQKLIEEGRKIKKPMYRQRTPGLDYYPFQK